MASEPKLHRLTGAPGLGDRERIVIACSEELAAMFDVTGETVHEIESVSTQMHTPRHANRILSRIGCDVGLRSRGGSKVALVGTNCRNVS